MNGLFSASRAAPRLLAAESLEQGLMFPPTAGRQFLVALSIFERLEDARRLGGGLRERWDREDLRHLDDAQFNGCFLCRLVIGEWRNEPLVLIELIKKRLQ